MTEALQHRLALDEFRRLRRRADLARVTARLAGRSTLLLPFHEVRRLLHAVERGERTLRDIRLDAIVGSVSRYQDFDREFRPLRDSDAQRWARVAAVVDSPEGAPPIEVFQIGASYFVADGNHRVSVARRHHLATISAFVTPLQPRVMPDGIMTEQTLLLAAELTEFFARTDLDRTRSAAALRVSALGAADELFQALEQFRQRYGMTDLHAAAVRWYDEEFVPVCVLIAQRGLHDAQLTAADLYLRLRELRDGLQRRLGWQLDDAAVVAALQRRDTTHDAVLNRSLPVELSATPAGSPAAPAADTGDHLFRLLLVPLSGAPGDWRALDQALTLAGHEAATILGLHVVERADQRGGPDATAICGELRQRCSAAGVSADCAIEVGQAARVIRARTHWCDLLILPLNHPPAASTFGRLTSHLSSLIRGSACPILLLPPGVQSALRHLLVAYDGSERAAAALALAGYLAARRRCRVSVVAVADERSQAERMLQQASAALQRYGVNAGVHVGRGDIADGIVLRAEAIGADVILIGGRNGHAVRDLLLGGVTTGLLRISRTALLICR